MKRDDRVRNGVVTIQQDKRNVCTYIFSQSIRGMIHRTRYRYNEKTKISRGGGREAVIVKAGAVRKLEIGSLQQYHQYHQKTD